MPHSKLRPSFTLTEDRLRELQAVVPEAFADGRINWDKLREALGETLEDEDKDKDKEHFGLFWPGKREARRLAALPSKGTLIPQPGAGVGEDSTHNLFIEGQRRRHGFLVDTADLADLPAAPRAAVDRRQRLSAQGDPSLWKKAHFGGSVAGP